MSCSWFPVEVKTCRPAVGRWGWSELAAGESADAGRPCGCGAFKVGVCPLSPAHPGSRGKHAEPADLSSGSGTCGEGGPDPAGLRSYPQPPARSPRPLRSRPARRWSPSLHPLAHVPAELRAFFPSRAAGTHRGSPRSAGVVPAPRGPGGAGKAEAGEASRIAACARSQASRVHAQLRIRQESGSVHPHFSDAP